MRRFLLAAAFVLFASAAFAQHPQSHVWLYRSPNNSTSSWGYNSPTFSYQSGYSPRQERSYGFRPNWSQPAYPVYPVAPAYGAWQGSYYWNWSY